MHDSFGCAIPRKQDEIHPMQLYRVAVWNKACMTNNDLVLPVQMTDTILREFSCSHASGLVTCLLE